MKGMMIHKLANFKFIPALYDTVKVIKFFLHWSVVMRIKQSSFCLYYLYSILLYKMDMLTLYGYLCYYCPSWSIYWWHFWNWIFYRYYFLQVVYLSSPLVCQYTLFDLVFICYLNNSLNLYCNSVRVCAWSMYCHFWGKKNS